MVALHHALEDEEGTPKKINEVYRDGSYYTASTGEKGNTRHRIKLTKANPRENSILHKTELRRNDYGNENGIFRFNFFIHCLSKLTL